MRPPVKATLTRLSALLLLGLATPTARAADVVVVKSKTITAYNDAVTAFNLACKASIKEFDMEGKDERGDKIIEIINGNPPSLVFAVGAQAAEKVRKSVDSKIPFIFSMVSGAKEEEFKTANSTGISMIIPPQQLLAAVKAIVPGTTKVGVAYNPKNSQAIIDQAAKSGESLGVQLIAAKVASKEDTPRAIRSSFSAGIDALWLISDPTVATEEGFKTMLDYSLSSKVPFIAYAEAFVQNGALASLAVNPENLGVQAGHLANRIISGEKIDSLPVEPPQKLNLSINLDTAKTIGRQCDTALAIFTYAARNDFAIKVYGGQ